jgi:hypothetical protein
LTVFPQLWGSRNTASIPVVAISVFLSRAQVVLQRCGHESRQRLLCVDSVVFDPLDECDRQIDVELLDLFIVCHAGILAT